MTSRSSARFTIDIDGKPRLLARIGKSRGNVYLSPIPAKFYLNEINTTQVEQHISIHPTPNNEELNVIKHSLVVLREGKAQKENITPKFHFTKAIKKTRSFAPLISIRSKSLKSEKYAPSLRSPPTVSLGEYHPDMYTLIVSFFVFKSDRVFKHIPQADLSVTQLVIEEYRIVVIWSFIVYPSFEWGELYFLDTSDPCQIHSEIQQKINSNIMNGANEKECFSFYRFARDIFKKKMMLEYNQEGGEMEKSDPALEVLFRYSKYGSLHGLNLLQLPPLDILC